MGFPPAGRVTGRGAFTAGRGAPRARRLRGLAVTLLVLGRVIFLAAPTAAAFVVVTALFGRWIERDGLRALFGLGICLGLPLLLRGRGLALFRRRGVRWAPDAGSFVAVSNALLALGLGLGMADLTGRALRRHGDWWVGESNGLLARGLRAGVGRTAAYLERFDPPAELAPVVLPPDPATVPFGPWEPGHEPPPAEPVVHAWFHPLAGPRRALPLSESRRFGASRPPPRPPECELGHCGVDLGTTTGEPVFAVFDGVVERIERDEPSGGRAGRYVRIGHREGQVVSRYIHLDSIRADLHEGDRVAGGELIGRVGRTGILISGPHLHFALSLRPGGPGADERFLDPEPLLRRWQLVDASQALRDLHAAADPPRRR